MKFYVTGCDAELTAAETLLATLGGLAVVFGPILLKIILGAIV